ncbi:MAG: choice-of-anchor Q domain-containing protein [Anaerolineales bacterium]
MKRSFTKSLMIILTSLALALSAIWVTPAYAADLWYVAPGGNDGNSCLSAASPCAAINAAIGKALDGDTIEVATGTYTGTGTEVALINKSIVLSGGWDASFTTQGGMSTIDGQGARRGMTVNSGMTVTMERFAIQNGLGGIWNMGALTLNNSIVSGNTYSAMYSIGGIYNSGTLTLNNSTVSSNTLSYSGSGGGISSSGALTLNNSTVSGNTAGNGGGIYSSGTLTLNNSTVSGNTSSNYGGGISRNAGTVTLTNTLVAGNSAVTGGPDCYGSIGSSGYNLIGSTTGCTFASSTGDLINIDPNLGVLIGAPGYIPLLAGSPAIDAGNPAGCSGSAGALTADERGAPRVGTCDIGAYEYTTSGAAASMMVYAGASQRAAPLGVFANRLRAAVLDSLGSPVSGVTVTFTAPGSGASGTFANTGNNSTTALTNTSGVAISSSFTANDQLGVYGVTASASGAGSVNFNLENALWYVSSSGSDANSCSAAASPCLTINAAIGKATSGDVIHIAIGTYTSSGAGYVVLIDKNITLSGGWDSSFAAQSGMSTIDAQNARMGVWMNSGALITNMDHFIIQNGRTSGGGGPGFTNNGTATISYSSIHDNSDTGSGNGGGIVNLANSSLTLVNTTVSNNSVGGQGGGIYTYGNLILKNSTISNNSAGTGGGIATYLGAMVQTTNSIIAGNTATNDSNCYAYSGSGFASLGNNIISSTADCKITARSGDQFGVDPQLSTFLPSQGYHPLLPGSPAIDAGNPANCLPTDQRGVARVGTCDIGAYEYTAPGPAASLWLFSGDGQRTAPLFAFSNPLTIAVLDGQGSPVPNANVTFSAPASGASGTFADTNTNLTSVLTNRSGIASASTFTANNQFGAYAVAGSITGLPAVNFNLENVAWYVSLSGNDSNSCALPANPCASMNAAIGKALAGDTIVVAAGTYTGTGAEVVLINKSIKFSGGWDAAFTTQNGTSVIDGQGARHGIFVDGDTTAIVEYFVIQNGFTGGDYSGGGGISNSGQLILNMTTVTNNSSNGYSVTGGGISNNDGGALILNNSTVSSNTTSGVGGGIAGGAVTINGSAVINNQASAGGGIDASGALILNNSTVSGNIASSQGGGIRTYGGNLNINNSTIANNSSTSGGGIYNGYVGPINLRNSILANNTGGSSPNCYGPLSSSGYNVIGNNSGCTFSASTGDKVGTNGSPINPQLDGLKNNGGPTFTYALLGGSPALNAGNPATPGSGGNACLATDQRGVARPVAARCDIGAYEGDPTMPGPISPAGKIGDATPTYTWGKIPGATNYQYLLVQGATTVYSKIVAASACGPIYCLDTPTTILANAVYQWRARSMVNGVWKDYGPYQIFTVAAPKAGFWSGTGTEFFVTPDHANIDNYAIYINIPACGIYNRKLVYIPFVPIINNAFTHKGSFYFSGTFTSPTISKDSMGLKRYYIAGCGYVSGGPFSVTNTWKSSRKPSSVDTEEFTLTVVTPAPDANFFYNLFTINP